MKIVRDRDGEIIEELEADQLPMPYREHDPLCIDGWLTEPDDLHPIPCLQCRPHLAPKGSQT